MDSITFTLLIKILLNVVLIAISINIVSFVSDIIDNKQIALRELLRFGIFLVVMAVVVSISYWLFILV